MRASIAVLVVAAAGLLVVPAPATAQLSQERTLTLTFDADGLVTLRAQNVRPSLRDVTRAHMRCRVARGGRTVGDADWHRNVYADGQHRQHPDAKDFDQPAGNARNNGVGHSPRRVD